MKQSRVPQEIRREQIVKAAMKIINLEGYGAFTTRRLAKEIGVTEPALYRHFRNKDEILISILEKMEGLWSEIIKDLKGKDDLEEQICSFIMMHFRYIEKNRDILAVLFADEYIRLNENLRSRQWEVTEKRFNYLVELLKDNIKKGKIKGDNPQALAMIIIGAIRITVLNWRNTEYSYSLSSMGEAICINLTKMLLSED